MNKIDQFIKRNKIRNSKLYKSGLIEGEDYIICPESKERLIIIRSDYITKVLGMTVEEYDKKYPNVQKRCQAHKNNIRSGLRQIDPVSGLTKYELSQQKARAVLATPDSNGITGYKRKGQKTRATHMNNVDEYGRNGYRRQADARLTTILPNGLSIEQNAHRKQRETIIRNNKTGTGGASKLSKRALKPVLEFLDDNNVRYYFDKSEFGIKDPDTKNYYFWDLTIPELKIAIEYQSDAWHANPILSEEEWKNWKTPRGKKKTADEALKYDYDKARSLYKNRGYLTYYIWQKSEKENIEEILCLLKMSITKS